MGMMPLESLSQDLQEKFGYDPQTAQAADDAEQAKKAREQQIVQQQRENAVQQTTGESYVSPYEGFCGKYSIVMATVEFTDAFKAAKDAQDQKKLGGF